MLSPPLFVEKTNMEVQVAVVDRLILYFQSFCVKTCQSKGYEDWFLRDNFDQHCAMHTIFGCSAHTHVTDIHQHIYVLATIENIFHE